MNLKSCFPCVSSYSPASKGREPGVAADHDELFKHLANGQGANKDTQFTSAVEDRARNNTENLNRRLGREDGKRMLSALSQLDRGTGIVSSYLKALRLTGSESDARNAVLLYLRDNSAAQTHFCSNKENAMPGEAFDNALATLDRALEKLGLNGTFQGVQKTKDKAAFLLAKLSSFEIAAQASPLPREVQPPAILIDDAKAHHHLLAALPQNDNPGAIIEKKTPAPQERSAKEKRDQDILEQLYTTKIQNCLPPRSSFAERRYPPLSFSDTTRQRKLNNEQTEDMKAFLVKNDIPVPTVLNLDSFISALKLDLPAFETYQSLGAHGYGHSYGDKNITRVLGATNNISKVNDKTIILQQATRGCTAAVAWMLITDKLGDKVNSDDRLGDLQATNLGDSDSISERITHAGLVPAVTEFDTIDELRGLLDKNGPAIVSVNSGVGSHVVIVDSITESGNAIIRDPYHGWMVEVTSDAFINSHPQEAIQIPPN